MIIERRYAELRAAGRVLQGRAIAYGDEATIAPGVRERFEPGAFGNVAAADVMLTTNHRRDRPLARTLGGGLVLADSAAALDVRAELPATRDADDALAMVRSGVLRGLSIEFEARRDRFVGGVRIVESARLSAVSVVDAPAYKLSKVEARQLEERQRGRAFMRATIPFRRRLACQCQRGPCKAVEFDETSFDALLASDDEVLAVGHGSFGRVLGSRRRGTLTLAKDRDGLAVGIAREAADTPAGAEIIASARVAPLYARPVLDEDGSTFAASGTGDDVVNRYSDASVRAILVKPTDNSDGWPEAEIMAGAAPTRRHRQRRRLWL